LEEKTRCQLETQTGNIHFITMLMERDEPRMEGMNWDVTDSQIRKEVAKIGPKYWKALLAAQFGVCRITPELYLVLDWDNSHSEVMVYTVLFLFITYFKL
jgi:hypothetical protein